MNDTLIALSNALGYIAEIQSYDPYSNEFARFCKTELGIEIELLKKVREISTVILLDLIHMKNVDFNKEDCCNLKI